MLKVAAVGFILTVPESKRESSVAESVFVYVGAPVADEQLAWLWGSHEMTSVFHGHLLLLGPEQDMGMGFLSLEMTPRKPAMESKALFTGQA